MANIGAPEFLLILVSLVPAVIGLGLGIAVAIAVWRGAKALERIASALERTAAPPASRG